MKVVFLNAKENKAPATIDIKDDLKVFYDLIGCRTIDIPTRQIGKHLYSIICDDEGLFDPEPKLSAFGENGQSLVGNLIIAGMPDDDGELTDLTDSQIAEIRKNTLTCIRENGGKIEIFYCLKIA